MMLAVLLSLVLVTTACAGAASRGKGATASGPSGSSPSSTVAGSAASTASTKPVGGSPSPTAAPTTVACALSLTHDTNDGFHVAVPSGWALSSLNGQIEVQRDQSGTEAVVIIPALETGGLTPASFFASSLSSVEQQTRSAGNTVTTTSQTQGDQPTATFTAQVRGQTLSGRASVHLLPLQTQMSSSEIVFAAYWAPTPTLTSEQTTLASVASCFGPEPATLFRVFKDQVFTYVMPPGWTVGDESQNSIDLHDGTVADVSYLLAEAIPSSQVDSPQSLITFFLTKLGFQSVQSIWATTGSPQTTASGASQATEYEEFTAMLNGVADHGIISALADVGGGVASGVVRLGLSIEPQWNALNSALIQMAGSVQHDFTQDLQQLQQVNQQWQNFSGQVANFDDVINNQQLVQNPTDGTFYEAPYSSYQVDGRAGPGYYLDTGQRLNPIERQ